jgi:superfamily II DNA/RNA helicase
VMADFHRGNCKLLVATSVLEQGIDVAACGVVICYDGVKSLKSIIQSRGRARQKKAIFIAFIAETGQRRANELSKMEVAMNYALLQLMSEHKSSFDPHLVREIEKFLESGGSNMGTPDTEENYEAEDDDDDLIEEASKSTVSLRFFNFIDSHALADHIYSFMTPKDRMKVTRRFIIAKFFVPDEGNDGTQIIKVCNIGLSFS